MDKDPQQQDRIFSKYAIRDFAKNEIWADIVETALSRALQRSEENDLLDPLTDATKIARNQGAIEDLKWITDLPRQMLVEAELIEREKEKEENES